MRWTRLAWAVAVTPIFGGCHTVYQPHRDHLAERAVSHSEQAILRQIHRQAREAWQAVHSEYPRKMFTPEFRDGFIEGYSDYLDRGGDAQPPAVPPLRYTQNKKYFTPEGHALLRDYFLGFKYGTDIAVATGQRQFLTVPVLIPDTDATELPSISNATPEPLPAPPQPLPAPRTVSQLPMPRRQPNAATPQRPVVMSPVDDGDSKFGPYAPLPENMKGPPLSIPTIPALPSVPKPPDGASTSVIPSSATEIFDPNAKLPEPPAEVPDLPADVPTPSKSDELLLPLPANHTVPPPLPANHPDPVKK
jgi:hypothetical protein